MKTITIRVPDDTYKELIKVKNYWYEKECLDKPYTWLEILKYTIEYDKIQEAYILTTKSRT